MKLVCTILLLSLVVAFAEKPHDHSFVDKVKEKTEHVIGNVKVTTNDAADTLNQAKYKVKNVARSLKETKDTLQEGFENAKEVLGVNEMIKDAKDAAKEKLSEISPITEDMTTIAHDAKKAIKESFSGSATDKKDAMGNPIFVEELKMGHSHLTESEQDKFQKKQKKIKKNKKDKL